MVNNCIVTNCTSDYVTGEKKPSFLFPKDKDICKKWIYFVNHKKLCPDNISHFHHKLIKRGKS